MNLLSRLLCLGLILCLLSCGRSTSTSVIGIWTCSPAKSTFKVPLNSAQRLANLRLTVDSDGTCELLTFRGTWSIESNVLRIELEDKASLLRYLQDANDHGQPIKLRIEDGLLLWDVGPGQGALIFERGSIASGDAQIV
jgi:hypothetical protein